jgi:hypothetical protein
VATPWPPGNSGSIGFVVAGLHKVTISAKSKGKTFTASRIVQWGFSDTDCAALIRRLI